jgi:hypothetical protein
MVARSAISGAVVAMGLFLCAGATAAQDSLVPIAAGWKMADVGHRPGDDSDRLVTIEKVIPEVDLIYRPSESNTAGSIQAEFPALKGCKPLSYNSGFDFGDPPADRAAEVRKQVHEAFVDFAKTCAVAPATEATLMTGFGEAFAAVDKLMTDKPNVYPPEPVDADANSQDQSPK